MEVLYKSPKQQSFEMAEKYKKEGMSDWDATNITTSSAGLERYKPELFEKTVEEDAEILDAGRIIDMAIEKGVNASGFLKAHNEQDIFTTTDFNNILGRMEAYQQAQVITGEQGFAESLLLSTGAVLSDPARIPEILGTALVSSTPLGLGARVAFGSAIGGVSEYAVEGAIQKEANTYNKSNQYMMAGLGAVLGGASAGIFGKRLTENVVPLNSKEVSDNSVIFDHETGQYVSQPLFDKDGNIVEDAVIGKEKSIFGSISTLGRLGRSASETMRNFAGLNKVNGVNATEFRDTVDYTKHRLNNATSDFIQEAMVLSSSLNKPQPQVSKELGQHVRSFINGGDVPEEYKPLVEKAVALRDFYKSEMKSAGMPVNDADNFFMRSFNEEAILNGGAEQFSKDFVEQNLDKYSQMLELELKLEREALETEIKTAKAEAKVKFDSDKAPSIAEKEAKVEAITDYISEGNVEVVRAEAKELIKPELEQLSVKEAKELSKLSDKESKLNTQLQDKEVEIRNAVEDIDKMPDIVKGTSKELRAKIAKRIDRIDFELKRIRNYQKRLKGRTGNAKTTYTNGRGIRKSMTVSEAKALSSTYLKRVETEFKGYQKEVADELGIDIASVDMKFLKDRKGEGVAKAVAKREKEISKMRVQLEGVKAKLDKLKTDRETLLTNTAKQMDDKVDNQVKNLLAKQLKQKGILEDKIKKLKVKQPTSASIKKKQQRLAQIAKMDVIAESKNQLNLQANKMYHAINNKDLILDNEFAFPTAKNLKERNLDYFNDVGMSKYIDQDIIAQMSKYSRDMSGRVATAKTYGFSTNGQWEKARESLKTKMLEEGLTEKQVKKEINMADLVVKESWDTNRARNAESFGQLSSRFLLSSNYSVLGGTMAFAALIGETGVVFTKHGAGTAMRALGLGGKEIFNLMKEKPLNSKQARTMQLITGSYDVLNGNAVQRYMDGAVDKVNNKAVNFAEGVAQGMGKYTFLSPLTASFRMSIGYGTLEDLFFTTIKKGSRAEKAMNRLGVTLEDMTAMRAYSNQVVVRKGNTIEEINLDALPSDLKNKALRAIHNASHLSIIKSNKLDQPPFMGDPNNIAMKLLLQFLTYPIQAYETLLLNGMKEADAKVVTGVAVTTGLATITGIIKEESKIAMGAMDEDDRKYTFDEEGWKNIATRAFMLNSFSSAPSTLTDMASRMFTGSPLGSTYRTGTDASLWGMLGPSAQRLSGLVEGLSDAGVDLADGEGMAWNTSYGEALMRESFLPFYTLPIVGDGLRMLNKEFEE
jgi:hypothetical protein